MDYVWTPWRYRYIVTAGREDRCVFCDAAAAGDDAAMLIAFRGRKNFVILNRFPYTSGHVMVVPYAHLATLSQLDSETLTEMFVLAQRLEGALQTIYHPEGYNVGLNIGRAAGAGPGRQRLRAALVVTEVGLVLVLLVGAALFTRAFLKLREESGGFDGRPLLR